MDDSERPSKIRKLSHDGKSATVPSDAVPALDQSTIAIQPSNHAVAAPSHPSTTVTGTTPSVSNNTNGSPPSQPLSKNQLKKLRKQQEWEAGKAERKAWLKEKDAEKKARKKEAKRKEAQERAAQGLDLVPQKTQWKRHVRLPITFLIDCGFDDKMLEKERNSLGSQITRCYSDNHKALFQAHLMVSSWGGNLRERFDNALGKVYVRWRGMQFLTEDFVAAAEIAKQNMARDGVNKFKGAFSKYTVAPEPTSKPVSEPIGTTAPAPLQTLPDAASEPATLSTPTPPAATLQHPNRNPHPKPTLLPTLDLNTLKSQGRLVYLTSDSPHTLTELTPYSTYIIGGLVDKNREKGLCYKIACERGIQTAKLPIGEYMEMQSRFVLATNHVVEIMIRWLECGDWGEAFLKVIPKRKGGRLKGEGEGEGEERRNGGDGGEDKEVDDDDHDEEDDGAGDDVIDVPDSDSVDEEDGGTELSVAAEGSDGPS